MTASDGIDWPIMQSDVGDVFGEPDDPSFDDDYIDNFVLGDLQPAYGHVHDLGDGFECNYVMIKPLRVALQAIADKGLAQYLRTFDGCHVVRPPKGGGMRWSMHAYGLAVDFNAGTNAYGSAPTMKPGIVQCFADAGFEWGGLWQPNKYRDGMHFQLPWIRIRSGEFAPTLWKPEEH